MRHPPAARRRRMRAWTDDIWKVHECLREDRPALFLLAIDAAPAGMLLVAGLDAGNRVLWSNYDPIVRQFVVDIESAEPPSHVIWRRGCISWSEAVVAEMCRAVWRCRSGYNTPGDVVALLRHAVASSDRC
jgi:hypothetical protein